MEGEGSLEFQEWEVHSDAEAVVVRSPVLEENRRSFEEIEVDSAGLSGWITSVLEKIGCLISLLLLELPVQGASHWTQVRLLPVSISSSKAFGGLPMFIEIMVRKEKKLFIAFTWLVVVLIVAAIGVNVVPATRQQSFEHLLLYGMEFDQLVSDLLSCEAKCESGLEENVKSRQLGFEEIEQKVGNEKDMTKFWSGSVGDGLVLGSGGYEQGAWSLELKVTLDDKVSQFMSRAARLNEAFSVVRRVPIVRPMLPAAGVNPWPVMGMELTNARDFLCS
ncbi:unnamed protein product [Linum tenue]|uniref:Uncharacterized protein n=1 Tax=Linum tenue TaxID=586396 RepID=A0AAV0H9R2_9ROSI|nr:unnamed protein product [Linum tenue]